MEEDNTIFIIKLFLLIIGIMAIILFIPILIGIGIALLFQTTGLQYYVVVITSACILWIIMILYWRM